MCHATDYEHLGTDLHLCSNPDCGAATDADHVEAMPDEVRGSGIPAEARAGAPSVPRYRPCERCGGTPAVHNPHPLNPAFVGHEYV